MIYSYLHEYSDAPDKYCKWSCQIRIEDNYWLRFYIYKNNKKLLKGATDRMFAEDGFLDSAGYFFAHYSEKVQFPFAFPKQVIFAEIHLEKKMMGAGYFTHELTHFLEAWMSTRPEDMEAEYAPTLMGRLTTNFWDWYYDNVDNKAEPK